MNLLNSSISKVIKCLIYDSGISSDKTFENFDVEQRNNLFDYSFIIVIIGEEN